MAKRRLAFGNKSGLRKRPVLPEEQPLITNKDYKMIRDPRHVGGGTYKGKIARKQGPTSALRKIFNTQKHGWKGRIRGWTRAAASDEAVAAVGAYSLSKAAEKFMEKVEKDRQKKEWIPKDKNVKLVPKKLPGDDMPKLNLNKKKKPVSMTGKRVGKPFFITVSGDQPSQPGIKRVRIEKMHTALKARSSVSGKTFKTTINLGKGLSKRWSTVATVNGRTTACVWDTLADLSSDLVGVDAKRQLLNLSHGFNRRLCYCPEYYAIPRIQTALNGSAEYTVGTNFNGVGENITQSTFGNDKIMGGIIGTKATHMFSNTTNVLPVYVRATVFYSEDIQVTSSTILDKVFGNPSGTQQPQAIPQNYLLEDTLAAVSQFHAGVISVAPFAKLSSSSYWRKNIKVAATRTVKLAPNDVWVLNINEVYPNGVDLTRCATLLKDVAEVPTSAAGQANLSYGLLFEQWGPRVDAIQFQDDSGSEATRQTYIGSAPGSVARESKLWFKMASAQRFIDPANGETQTDNGVTYAIHIVRDVQRRVKVFNRAPGLIGKPGEAGKDLYIPMEVDTNIRYADTQEDNVSTGE